MSDIDLLILGNINADLILGPLEDWPQAGTERLVEHLSWRVGGNAGNAAVACAALGTAWASASTVGDDLAGQWLRRQLPRVQWRTVSAPTSLSVAVMHPDGERTFLTHLGHLAGLRWEDLYRGTGESAEGGGDREDRPACPNARMVLLAGAFLTPALRAQYPALLRSFQAQGSEVAADFGWPDGGFTPQVQQEVSGWLPQVQHLLVNELEARHLSGQAETQDALRQLAASLHPQGTVVIKCGARGVVAQHQGQQYQQAAPSVTVLDSVGAGDTWNAAYLHARLRGQALPEALHFATRVASTAISTQPRQFAASPGHLED